MRILTWNKIVCHRERRRTLLKSTDDSVWSLIPFRFSLVQPWNIRWFYSCATSSRLLDSLKVKTKKVNDPLLLSMHRWISFSSISLNKQYQKLLCPTDDQIQNHQRWTDDLHWTKRKSIGIESSILFTSKPFSGRCLPSLLQDENVECIVEKRWQTLAAHEAARPLNYSTSLVNKYTTSRRDIEKHQKKLWQLRFRHNPVNRTI